MRVGVILVIAGCGRLGFDPLTTSTDGAPSDTPPSDTPPDAACTWSPWSAPVVLPAPLNTTFDEWSPGTFLGNTQMMFHRYQIAGQGGDLYLASRATTADAFGSVTRITELDNTQDQWTPTVTEDGLVVVFAENVGGFDLVQTTRTSIAAAFSPATALANVNAGGVDDTEPWIDPDGLAMVFGSRRGGNTYQLYETTRATRTAAFAAPTRLELGGDAQDPTLSVDRLELVFASRRAGGLGLTDLWTARRPAIDQPFGTPTPLLDLSSARDDVGPEMSRDGTTLYFDRDALTAGGGQADISAATRACL